MRFINFAMAFALAIPCFTPAFAADAAPAVPQRYRSVQLRPGEKCPPAVGGEVVVCGTLDEPYRIPKQFRHTTIAAADQSWVNRAATMDEVGRVAAGLPDTCSMVGTGGQTGCMQATMRAWAAERRAIKQEADSIP